MIKLRRVTRMFAHSGNTPFYHLVTRSHGLQTHVKDSVPLNSGAGAILQVALQGGVFCWLQRMDCRHFNRLVQVISNQANIQLHLLCLRY